MLYCVEQALRGGPDAFRQIVDRFQNAVFAVALSRVRDFHLAEDVAQLVFTEAYQKLASLKEPEKLGGWLRAITVRRSLNAIRSKRDEVAIQEDGSDNLLIGDANEDLEREDLKRRVGKAIGSLGEALRETTILFYMDGYSIGEIAPMMGGAHWNGKTSSARCPCKSEIGDDGFDQGHTEIREAGRRLWRSGLCNDSSIRNRAG
jgi:RNA polymerase sigma-70 factor (ECF subfamily)